MILGNLGVETDHPPKMCAGLGVYTAATIPVESPWQANCCRDYTVGLVAEDGHLWTTQQGPLR